MNNISKIEKLIENPSFRYYSLSKILDQILIYLIYSVYDKRRDSDYNKSISLFDTFWVHICICFIMIEAYININMLHFLLYIGYWFPETPFLLFPQHNKHNQYSYHTEKEESSQNASNKISEILWGKFENSYFLGVDQCHQSCITTYNSVIIVSIYYVVSYNIKSHF